MYYIVSIVSIKIDAWDVAVYWVRLTEMINRLIEQKVLS